MSLVMTELSDDVLHAPDPSFNPKVFSEDEEEERNPSSDKAYPPHPPGGSSGGAIPIAPMTPRREENRSRILNSILNMADGNGNHFFRSPRFVYTNPSLLRERTEMRKALINGSKSIPTTSQEEDEKTSHLSGSETPTRIDRSLSPSSSTKPLPSVFNFERNASHTYQNERRDEAEGSEKPLEDETSADFNLTEVINFCENFKIGDVDGKGKIPLKIRQEKTETCFLNNQRPVKTQNPQSPKNTIAPCNFSSDNRTLDTIAGHSSGDFSSQNIQKMKNALEKRLINEKISVENFKYIDEDPNSLIDRMSRSCSVGYLDDVDTGLVPCELTLKLLKKGSPKRLVLVGGPKKKNPCSQPPKTKSTLKTCGKSRSFDSGELLLTNKSERNFSSKKEEVVEPKAAETSTKIESIITQKKDSLRENVTGSNICLAGSSREPISPPSPRLPRSQPVTPAMSKKKRNQSASPIRKHLLNSPLLRRRRAKSKAESSDDDNAFSGDEAFTSSSHFKDLETFQKAQLRQKLKRGKVRDGNTTPKVRELVMHNKAPMWNENSQVYQLDFGGRVTQESAKNFQIEFKGKQVMQFGRIDGNAYTLDFQYPFSVLQAFSVALANVTQRLK